MFDHHLKHPERIVNISDRDLFQAIRVEAIHHAGLQQALAKADYHGAYAAYWEYLQTRESPHHPYFQGSTRILERIPRNQKLADLILDGKTYRIDTTEFDFSGPIDFDSIPGVTTKHGFHYLTWMDCLQHAAIEKKDPAYLEAYENLFVQWYEQRENIKRARPSNDVVFYELGLAGRSIRLMNFLYTALFLDAGNSLHPQTIAKLFKTFLGAARWLQLEQDEKGYREGNWQIFAIRYLLQFGILFPEFKEAEGFRRTAATYIEAHLERDFYEDGGHSERCFSYGTSILTHIDEFIQFTRSNPALETPQSYDWTEKAKPIFEWYLKTVAPGPEFPGFGDGEFLRLTAPFTTAFELFQDPRFLWPVKHLNPDWESQAEDPGYRSLQLPSSEFCILRDGFEPTDTYMFINHGGFPGGHSHQDLLDFTLYAKGVPLAADVARFNGYDQPWDLYFRSPQAHNQFTVEGAVMDRPNYRGEGIQFGTSEYVDTFSGLHQAYRQTAGIVMERRILFLKPLGYLILDTASKVELQPEQALYKSARNSFLWHLHAPFPFQLGPDSARANSGKAGLLILPEDKTSLRFGYTGIDYLQENTEAFPHWKGREDPILWPDRYFLNLRTWNRNHPYTPMDVALLPYDQDAPEATLVRDPSRVTGEPQPHVCPRALSLQKDEARYQILIGDSGSLLEFEQGRFSGHLAVIRYHREKPTGIYLQDTSKLEFLGKNYSTQPQSSQWIDLP